MKMFRENQLSEAKAYAAAGEQALHLHRIIANRAKAPRCFVTAVDRGEWIAHLFDADEARLIATARRLGVRIVVVERRGTPRQHIDLCGKPLGKAIAMCDGTEPNPSTITPSESRQSCLPDGSTTPGLSR